MKNTTPHYPQLYSMEFGSTCLRMISKYDGCNFPVQSLREKSFITREGVSMLGIGDATESIGFRINGVKITFERLVNEKYYSCILINTL